MIAEFIKQKTKRTNIKDLDRGDIIYIYNQTSNSFCELEMSKHNVNDTTQFRLTGKTFPEIPEGGKFITTVKMKSDVLADGSICIGIEELNRLSAMVLSLKLSIKNFISSFD